MPENKNKREYTLYITSGRHCKIYQTAWINIWIY